MTLFQDCIKSITNFFSVSCLKNSKAVETNPEHVKEPEPPLIDTSVVELVPVIDIDEYADLPDLIPIDEELIAVISNNNVEEYQTDEELILIDNDSDDERDY